MAVNGAIKAAQERARTDKLLGSSLQSAVVLSILDPKSEAVLRSYADELDALFVVSSVELMAPMPSNPVWSYSQEIVLGDGNVSDGGGRVVGTVTVLPPEHAKCPRCWRYVAPEEDALCARCEDVVKSV